MNTVELLGKLKTFKNFIGVFPCDKTPKVKKKVFGIIINTDKADQKGQHWVSYFVKNGKGEYFDSFGLPPYNQHILKFVKVYSKKGFTWNKQQVQDVKSTTCGNYCVLFLACKFKGVPTKTFKLLFCKNFKTNDKLVYKLLDKRKHVKSVQ